MNATSQTVIKTYSPEHADIANWLRVQGRDGCCRVVLCQRVGPENQHVREWPLTAELDIDLLAEDVSNRMSEEARVLRGPTTYMLFGFKPGARAYSDRKIIRFEGMGASPDMLLGETEQPDGRGIISQMMRHNEASARISLGQTMAIVEHYKAILHERDTRIATLEAKMAEVAELHERLVSMEHERNLELFRQKRADRQQAFVREKLDMLTPAIMSKVFGAGAAPGKGTIFGEELLRQFLKSLGPEQFAAISNALNPEQVVTLHEIFTRYSDRETERQKATADAEANDNSQTPPAPQASGGSEATGAPAPSQDGAEPINQKKK